MKHRTYEVSEGLFDTAIHVVLSLLMIITLYPIVHVTFASLSDSNALIAHKGLLLRPLGLNFEAYKLVFENKDIITGYMNTLFIVVAGVVLNLFFTSLGAFVVSRKNVLWNKFFIAFIMFTMFFSGGLIPFYLIVKGIGLNNSLWATVIPFLVNTFNLIVMRTAFQSVPDSLEESAKIDGANYFTILFRIVIPLSLPVIAVIGMFYAVEKWNGWFYASIFLQDRKLFPLQIILREILIQNSTDAMTASAQASESAQIGESVKYATIMVATIPVLVIYPFIQKYFVKGVMIGALKG